ncbi:hypothetical protein [Stenotrophomonas sp.]|uniref:hypothetical protein n=1 Tax=Stenotrophomonas sp. TaxID=69392 RepID=UPI0028A697A5|nr:hypothetical protein [Stenotrophomonas sp.]
MSDEAQNTLDAVKEEVKNAVSTRFNSPFLGAFIVSWLAWNHRLIFVLFSGMTVDERFHYIDERLYPTAAVFAWMHIVGPILSALAYILLLPWPTEWVHKWNLTRKLRLKYAELSSEGNRLLTQEESDEYRAEVTELKRKLNEKRIELLEQRRKVSAMAILTQEGVTAELSDQQHRAYLASQAFIVEVGQINHDSSPWYFRDGDEVSIQKMRMNLRWHFSKGQLHFFDADEEKGNLGFLTFNPAIKKYEGRLVGLGDVRLRGAHYSSDFNI